MFLTSSIFNTIYNDAPEPWQVGFQDSAAPGYTGIVELHDTIFFYLIVICIGVFWVLGSTIYYFNKKKSPIVHKYLNHGEEDVPIHQLKLYKIHIKWLGKTIYLHIPDRRYYTTVSQKNLDVNYVKENKVNSAFISRNHIGETQNLMSLRKENNDFSGQTPSESDSIRQTALDLKHSENTKFKMNAVSGNHINIYEKFSSEGFYLIGTFVSARRAGKFLDISGSSITNFTNTGEIYKYRYKFSSK